MVSDLWMVRVRKKSCGSGSADICIHSPHTFGSCCSVQAVLQLQAELTRGYTLMQYDLFTLMKNEISFFSKSRATRFARPAGSITVNNKQ